MRPYRINSLELRKVKTCGKYLEIVKWFTDSEGRSFCYTVASWKGEDLEFIGDRVFSKKIDKKDFWKLAKKGQKIAKKSRGNKF